MDNLRLSDFLRRIVVASVAYAMAKSVLVACAMAAAPAERSKNLIENGEFAVKGDADLPDGWTIVAPNEALRPKFSAEKNSNGSGALAVQGNGRKECFGYARHPLHLTGGKTYCLQVRFRFEGFEDVNRHLVHAIHSVPQSQFNEGVFEYRREGNSVIGERSFAGPAKDIDAEMRLYYRFSPAGKVVWQSVTLEECEPLAVRPVKIAVSSGWGDLEHWSKFLDAAGQRGADIVLLPEFCNVCKADSDKPAKPESLDGPTATFMAAKAKQWKMYVAGTFARRDGDLVYNSAPLFDRQGKLVGVYDKNLLFDPELEHGTTPGVGYPVFKTDFGKVAIMTCYDSWFPEPARLLGYKGAELVLLPNAGYYRELMPARAADNGVAVAVSSLNCPAGIWDSGGNQAGRAEAEETHFAPRDAIKGFEKLDDLGMVLATIDLSKRPSPHYWGGPMLSAPGGRRVRFTWRESVDDEIAREARRWHDGSVAAATPAASAANPAKSNAAELLRQRVLADYPRLRDEKLTDWERVGLLRQWAWSHVNLACTKSNLVDCDPRIPWRELDAPGIFQLFGDMRGGVFCGGTSRALAELYKLFGYEAWMVNSGSTGAESATHVITLVRIQDKGQSMLSMQDAYFNLAYADAITGAPLDYFKMLELLAHGKHASIAVVEPDHLRISPWPVTLLCAKDRGNSTPQQIARGAFSVLEAHYTHEELPDGSLKLVSPRTAAKFLADQCYDRDGNPRWYFAWLREQGHPLCINYLFLYPLGIEGRDSDAMMKRATRIAGPAQNPAQQKSAAAVSSTGPRTK